MKYVRIIWTLVGLSYLGFGVSAYAKQNWVMVAAASFGVSAAIVGFGAERLREQNIASLKRTIVAQRQTLASQNRTITTMNRMRDGR